MKRQVFLAKSHKIQHILVSLDFEYKLHHQHHKHQVLNSIIIQNNNQYSLLSQIKGLGYPQLLQFAQHALIDFLSSTRQL